MSRMRESSDAAAAAPPAAESLLQGVRGGLRDAVELLRVRLALLGTEAAAHALDVAQALAWAVAAAVLLALGLGFLAVLLTVALWDSHRLLALAVFSTLFLGGGAAALWLARRTLGSVHWFEASVTELARDGERLRGQP
ncbi:phage holin family protein [Tepidimonas charontis]|uniref:phage holin family protein n=1 Tax=Tepidimonas charontis TaxID=2267262 RepID=UPI001F18520B|nr:phage holin family protein [Tepidimonas charontis]